MNQRKFRLKYAVLFQEPCPFGPEFARDFILQRMGAYSQGYRAGRRREITIVEAINAIAAQA